MKNSGQLAEFWTRKVRKVVELAGIEPATSCMPCESSLKHKPLIEQLKLPFETSRIVSRTDSLSIGLAKNWLGNSGRFLSPAQIEYARVSGLTDAAVSRVLRRSLSAVRRARIGLTHGLHPTPPDRAPREGAGRYSSPQARPARVRRAPDSIGDP